MPDNVAPLLGGGNVDDGGETGDQPRPPPRRLGATPTATTLILLGDMFGLGALSLPSVFARFGWLPATALLLLFSAATIYSSRLFALLWRLAPRARVFDDYGALAMGKTGKRLTYLGVYLCIFFEPPIFAVTVAESLRVLGLFAKSNVSTAVATALIMIPLAQVQELEGVAAFSAVGVAGMAVAAAAAVACLLGVPTPLPPKIISDRKPTRLVRTSGVGAASLAAAFFDVVFTYGGQVNWNRYTTGMQDPSQFPRCVAVSVALMSGAYAVVGGVGYFVLGEAFDYSKPLTSLLPAGVDVVVANVGLLAHTLLAFMININVWTHLCLHLTCGEPLLDDEDDGESQGAPPRSSPSDGGEEGAEQANSNHHHHHHHHSNQHSLRWALASTLCVLYSVLVAALLPFFSSLMAVVASLGDLAGAYALPALFALVLAAKSGNPLGRAESLLCRLLIPLSLLLSAAGMVLSVKNLVDDMGNRS